MKCDVCGEEVYGISYRICEHCESVICDNCNNLHFCAICKEEMCPKCGNDFDEEICDSCQQYLTETFGPVLEDIKQARKSNKYGSVLGHELVENNLKSAIQQLEKYIKAEDKK